MRYYIQDRAVAYGCLEELDIDPMTVRACTPTWNISVIARMPQKEITMKMKVGGILRKQLAVQADRFLETIVESCYSVTSSQAIIREQEAAGVCYLCAMCGHTSVDCPRLKSGAPQIEAERMGKWYQITTNKISQGLTRSGKNQSWIPELPCTNKLELVSVIVTRRKNLKGRVTRKLLETIAM